MRMSKKSYLLLLSLIVLLAILLIKLRLNSKYVDVFLAIFLFILLSYQIISEVGENYEDKPEDDYVLFLVEKVKDVHPAVTKVIPKLKFFEGKRSYTINKTYVHICKKDEKGKLYHENQLMLVLLHEIAHTICDEVGHTDKFQKILDELLLAAEKKGLYNPKIPHVPNYCEY